MRRLCLRTHAAHRLPSLIGWAQPAAGSQACSCCDQQLCLNASNYAKGLLHSLKHELLGELRHAPVHKEAILRGAVPAKMRDCCWVSTAMAVSDPLIGTGTAIVVEDTTWRNWAVWISSTLLVNQLLRRDVTGDEFWEAGRLHVLPSAPRTWSGQPRLNAA